MPIAVKPSSPTTYNPRDNSPIKAPDVEYCITCGQQLPTKVKPMTNEMSQYLNGDDKKGIVVVASVDPTLELKGVTFYRIKGYDHEGKPITFVTMPGSKVEAPKPSLDEPKK